MINTLYEIGKILNKNKVRWGIGASLLLNNYGLVDKPKDIDILISLDDIDNTDKLLSNMGDKKIYENVNLYSTQYFYEYLINGIDIDVMAGLCIKHDRGTYEYIFDKLSIVDYFCINKIEIPLMSLEDWYVIYNLIPNREEKVKIIENYLMKNGIKKPELLKRALLGNLPDNVRNRVEELLLKNS